MNDETDDDVRKDISANDSAGHRRNTVRFDLADRTTRFGEEIIAFARQIPVSPVTGRLIDQLVGAGTSVGANYCEADDAVSKRDFRHKISLCKREARECCFFIQMVVKAEPHLRVKALPLWQESRELHLIFARIYRSCLDS